MANADISFRRWIRGIQAISFELFKAAIAFNVFCSSGAKLKGTVHAPEHMAEPDGSSLHHIVSRTSTPDSTGPAVRDYVPHRLLKSVPYPVPLEDYVETDVPLASGRTWGSSRCL